MNLLERLKTEGLINQSQFDGSYDYINNGGQDIYDFLIRSKFIEPEQILGIIEQAFGCKTVNIKNIDIPQNVLDFIPAATAWNNKVLPFNYDISSKTVSVACINPFDSKMKDVLQLSLKDYIVEFFMAIPSFLNCAILDKYRVQLAASNSNEGKSLQVEKNFLSIDQYFKMEANLSDSTESILIVTGDVTFEKELSESLITEGYNVFLIADIEEAKQLVNKEKVILVLIHDRNEKHLIKDLSDKIRVVSPSINIQTYGTLKDILFHKKLSSQMSELLEQNYKFLTTILFADQKNEQINNNIVKFVKSICKSLKISGCDQIHIMNAAYLYELSLMYTGRTENSSWENKLSYMSSGKFDVTDFPAPVLSILRNMYREINEHHFQHLPLKVLGSNILTIVDFFYKNYSESLKISIEQFDNVKKNLKSLSGKLFLPIIVETFIGLLRRELVAIPEKDGSFLVLVYDESGSDIYMLENCLHNFGFSVTFTDSKETFIRKLEDRQPDIALIVNNNEEKNIIDFFSSLVVSGISFDSLPMLLLTDSKNISELNGLLKIGVEDIFNVDNDIDQLMIKINRIRSRKRSEVSQRLNVIQELGTHGSLENMNLIDLLQMMGCSKKTVSLSVTGAGKQLLIYLDQGQITYAECEDKVGADAVYDAIEWEKGVWSIDPIDSEKLPIPNNELPNDLILIEGCRLLDEKKRQNQSV